MAPRIHLALGDEEGHADVAELAVAEVRSAVADVTARSAQEQRQPALRRQRVGGRGGRRRAAPRRGTSGGAGLRRVSEAPAPATSTATPARRHLRHAGRAVIARADRLGCARSAPRRQAVHPAHRAAGAGSAPTGCRWRHPSCTNAACSGGQAERRCAGCRPTAVGCPSVSALVMAAGAGQPPWRDRRASWNSTAPKAMAVADLTRG
jgi:hypothetical protein